MTRLKPIGMVILVLTGLVALIQAQDPISIQDDAFWRMITDFSEHGGSFRYENLVSNEISYQTVIPSLKQNFTYIAAIEPRIAFIVDIRRENMLEHLMYKALFEMSGNRTEFVSRLFSRKRPPSLAGEPSAEELLKVYSSQTCDRQLLAVTFQGVTDRLTTDHGFVLTEDDRKAVQHALETFCAAGPQIDYGFVNAPSNLTAPSYAELMTATDTRGRSWSYLANAENFDRIRNMELKNLIVPLVGNFAGNKALRSVGQYLKSHDLTVSASTSPTSSSI
jgi:hypothetical protein